MISTMRELWGNDNAKRNYPDTLDHHNESEPEFSEADSTFESDVIDQQDCLSPPQDKIFYAPEEARVIFEGTTYMVIFNNAIITSNEIKINEMGQKPWSFCIHKGVIPSTEFQALIDASTSNYSSLQNSVNLNAKFKAAIPLFDKHIKDLTGWDPISEGPPAFKCQQFNMSDSLNTLAEKVSKGDNNKLKNCTIKLDAENPLLHYLQAPSITSKDIKRGMTLSVGLGEVHTTDATTDLVARQKALKAFTIVESLYTARCALAEVVNLSSNHSAHDRDRRILQVCSLMQVVEEICQNFTTLLMTDSFNIRMNIRKKVLGNLQPLELRKTLLESPLLDYSVFPEKSLTAADLLTEPAITIPLTKGLHIQKQRLVTNVLANFLTLQ